MNLGDGCSMRPLFIVQYNNRNDNLGDQFIFRSLANTLSTFGDVIIQGSSPAFVGNLPEEGGKWHSRFVRGLAAMKGRRIYNVLAPGAALWNMPQATHLTERSGLRAFVARRLSGKTIALGRSVIPTADHGWCRGVDWIGVRDHDSLSALRNHGIDRAHYFPDLAFLDEQNQTREWDSRGGILLSFRPTIPESKHSITYKSQIQQSLQSIVSHFREHGGDNDFRISHQVESDKDFGDEISEFIRSPQIPNCLTLESYQSIYEGVQIVVSNRLHVLLLAARCGALPIALTTRQHTKLVSLFTTVGLEPLLIFAEDSQSVASRFIEIVNRTKALKCMVDEMLVSQRTVAIQILDQVIGK